MIQKNISLKNLNTWQVGGSAEFYSKPSSLEELKEDINWANSKSLKITILGGGSNVLISDHGIKGLVIHTSNLTGLESEVVDTKLKVKVWCGTTKAELLKVLLKHKAEAALFLAGLPGQVGGGISMNAGVGEMIQPREFVEIVEWVESIDLKSLQIKTRKKSELTWEYRRCLGLENEMVLRVGLVFDQIEKSDILERVRKANQVRSQKQPLDMPSCGSVFVNPPGDRAGRLIEAAGLKGLQIGGAQVSTKHANFIVNTSNASAQDILNVIEAVQKEVFRQFQVQLKTEVVRMGEFF